MGILVDKDTRVLVQGITGHDGSFHTARMLAYGTNVVAGVTPGKGGREVEGVPVFNTIKEAVAETGAQASVVFVGARFAPAALCEAIDNGLETVACITEGIAVKDMLEVKRRLRHARTRLIGSLATPRGRPIGANQTLGRRYRFPRRCRRDPRRGARNRGEAKLR